MTEFTKLKITFALALMGTLFALHPFIDRVAERGFLYLGYDLKIFYAYALTAGLLSVCVYCYAVTMMNDRPHSWCERTGNASYALAVLVLPVKAGFFSRRSWPTGSPCRTWPGPRRRWRRDWAGGGSPCRNWWPGGSAVGSASRTGRPRWRSSPARRLAR